MLNGVGDKAEVASALEACRSTGGVAEHHGADLSDPNQITELFECMMQRWGRTPDILVNNAGK